MRGQVTEVLNVYGMQGRQLVIPVYQRNYDWGQRQCQQLLDDLVDVIQEGRPKHFFGAVVGQPEGSWRWVVIDGQQRLTTVSLLMLALADLLDEGVLKSADEDRANLIRKTFLLLDEATNTPRFKLKPVKNDARAYGSLFGPTSEHIDTSSVTANYRFFLEEIPKLRIDVDQLWSAIERLEVMHLDLESHDDAQRIFESLNSTGLALSEADKVRNLVLMGLPSAEQNRVYEDYWNRIEESVGYETGSFLRWFLITKTPRTPRRDQVYDAFKAYAADLNKTGSELLEEVRRYSRYFNQIRTASTGTPQIDFRLQRINLLRSEVVLPLLMPLLGELEEETITTKDLSRCLRIVESYIFRRTVCRIPTNALNSIFASLYRDVTRLRPENSPFADVLAYSLRRRTGSGAFPDDETFAEAFVAEDLYHFQSERRKYLFECLENLDSNDTRDIAYGLESGVLTVEHIMPQTLPESWHVMLGPNSDAIHETWLHRIGNLTVTGYNSAYSNASFDSKKTRENGFDSSPFRLNHEMREATTWGEEHFRRRTERLLGDALSYWVYPQTDFEPPRPQLPTEPLGDDTDFTGRTVVGFSYNEHHATVQNWRDLTTRVFEVVLFLNRENFMSFAREIEWFRIGDHFDTEERGVYKIDEGIGWNASSSTSTKVSLMRRLFEHSELNTDDLVLTLRPDEDKNSTPDKESQYANSEPAFADLVKFLPVFDELVESREDSDLVEQTVEEFMQAFARFRIPDPSRVLGTTAANYIAESEDMGKSSSREILAIISAKLIEQELIDSAALANTIVDGSLKFWVSKLANVEVPA